jgi:hypothetical protein
LSLQKLPSGAPSLKRQAFTLIETLNAYCLKRLRVSVKAIHQATLA